jgi:transcriptional regulator with XRE-family HTH domain
VILDSENFFARVQEALGLETAPKIARKLGLVKQTVYDWKNKKVIPELKILLLISESSRTSLHWLLTGRGAKFVDEDKSKSLAAPGENVLYFNLDKRVTQIEKELEDHRHEMGKIKQQVDLQAAMAATGATIIQASQVWTRAVDGKNAEEIAAETGIKLSLVQKLLDEFQEDSANRTKKG